MEGDTSPSPGRLRRTGRQGRKTAGGGEAPRGEGPGPGRQAPSPLLAPAQHASPLPLGLLGATLVHPSLRLFLRLLTKRSGDGDNRDGCVSVGAEGIGELEFSILLCT